MVLPEFAQAPASTETDTLTSGDLGLSALVPRGRQTSLTLRANSEDPELSLHLFRDETESPSSEDSDLSNDEKEPPTSEASDQAPRRNSDEKKSPTLKDPDLSPGPHRAPEPTSPTRIKSPRSLLKKGREHFANQPSKIAKIAAANKKLIPNLEQEYCAYFSEFVSTKDGKSANEKLNQQINALRYPNGPQNQERLCNEMALRLEYQKIFFPAAVHALVPETEFFSAEEMANLAEQLESKSIILAKGLRQAVHEKIAKSPAGCWETFNCHILRTLAEWKGSSLPLLNPTENIMVSEAEQFKFDVNALNTGLYRSTGIGEAMFSIFRPYMEKGIAPFVMATSKALESLSKKLVATNGIQLMENPKAAKIVFDTVGKMLKMMEEFEFPPTIQALHFESAFAALDRAAAKKVAATEDPKRKTEILSILNKAKLSITRNMVMRMFYAEILMVVPPPAAKKKRGDTARLGATVTPEQDLLRRMIGGVFIKVSNGMVDRTWPDQVVASFETHATNLEAHYRKMANLPEATKDTKNH
jgi:hypothetical protein